MVFQRKTKLWWKYYILVIEQSQSPQNIQVHKQDPILSSPVLWIIVLQLDGQSSRLLEQMLVHT